MGRTNKGKITRTMTKNRLKIKKTTILTTEKSQQRKKSKISCQQDDSGTGFWKGSFSID